MVRIVLDLILLPASVIVKRVRFQLGIFSSSVPNSGKLGNMCGLVANLLKLSKEYDQICGENSNLWRTFTFSWYSIEFYIGLLPRLIIFIAHAAAPTELAIVDESLLATSPTAKTLSEIVSLDCPVTM